MECAICLGSLQPGQALVCCSENTMHTFHQQCDARHRDTGATTCPLCRCEGPSRRNQLVEKLLVEGTIPHTVEEFTFTDGSTYKGEWKHNKPEGKGTMRRPNGAVFTGTFADGSLTTGTIVYPSGNKYEGECRDSCPEGEGTKTLQDGTILRGAFKNGRLTRGVISYPTGITYEGECRNNRPYGPGTKTYPDGTTLRGSFREGRHCFGNLVDCFGNEYTGNTREDKPHGTGQRLIKKTGTSMTGEWVHGEFRSGSKFLQDGTVFRGKFVSVVVDNTRRHRLHGQGKVTYPDKRIEEGQFRNGQLVRGTVKELDGARVVRTRRVPAEPEVKEEVGVLGKRTLDERLNDEMEAAYARGEVIDLT